MLPHVTRLVSLLSSIVLAALLTGCASLGFHRKDESTGPPQPPAFAPSDVILYDGESGNALGWDTLLQRAASADVILLGELHDHALGHGFQRVFLTDLYKHCKPALCTEMFERDEQPMLDAYLAGKLSQRSLVAITDSTHWGAKGMWNAWYQPLVDCASSAGAPVIAANTPRRFASLARMEGNEPLTRLQSEYPRQYVIPRAIEQEAYRERFSEVMKPPPEAKKKRGKKQAHPHGMGTMNEKVIDAFFRGQQLWDATMADSVLAAFHRHGQAVLVVGSFHIDYEGGVVLRLRDAHPALRILTISVQREPAAGLTQDDKGRAHVVVYPIAD